MRALVLPDEAAETYGKYLTHLPDDKLNDLYYEEYVQDCADRRATAASVFQMNNSGFHAEITLGKENLVFFSVPYDDGFTAYVNGQETEIVEVDEGLMAVLCPAGENTIDFVYQPDGIRLSRPLTFGGIGVWLVYTRHTLSGASAGRMTLPRRKNKILQLPLDFIRIKCIMQSNR